MLLDFQNNCKLTRFLNRMDFQLHSGKIYRYIFIALISLITSMKSYAQIPVFFDDFGTTTGICDSFNLAAGFNSPVSAGIWNVNPIGGQGPNANEWFISSTEPGKQAGLCSEKGCKTDPSETKRTLHIANVPGSENASGAAVNCPAGDCGAVYDPGGFLQTTPTEKRVESPVINCLGVSDLKLGFNYILGELDGELTNNDNCFVEYFNGSTWTTLAELPKTVKCLADTNFATWTNYTISLPASADNNPLVQIGFRWKNQGLGVGVSGPSVAIDSIIVISLDVPIADFTASDTVICAGDTVNFYADTTTFATSYNWTFIGGTPGASSAQNPTNIVFQNPGTYSVMLVVSSPAGADTMQKFNYIVANACTPPNPDFVASDSLICERDCITFTDLSTGGATTWAWSFPGGVPSTSTSPNPSVCYSAPGLYDVTLTAGNQYGTASFTKTAYIRADTCPLPEADFIAPVQMACSNTPFSFQGQIIAGGPFTSWSWSFPGAVPDTSSLQNPTGILYTADGLYDVQLIVTNQYGSDTIIQYSFIRIESVPTAFVGPDTSMFWGSSYQLSAGGGVTYSWSPALGLDSATSPNPIASPLETTVYVVTISDGFGCFTTRQVVITILHNNDYFVPTAFSPNGDGRNDYLFLRGNNLYGIRFSIYDRWGEKVFETTNQSVGWDGTYKGKDLNPGVFTYVFTINFDDESSVSKTGSVTLIR